MEPSAHTNLIGRSMITSQPVIAQQHSSVKLVSMHLHYRKLKFGAPFSNVMICFFYVLKTA
jgi:hypothetical protein